MGGWGGWAEELCLRGAIIALHGDIAQQAMHVCDGRGQRARAVRRAGMAARGTARTSRRPDPRPGPASKPSRHDTKQARTRQLLRVRLGAPRPDDLGGLQVLPGQLQVAAGGPAVLALLLAALLAALASGRVARGRGGRLALAAVLLLCAAGRGGVVLRGAGG